VTLTAPAARPTRSSRSCNEGKRSRRDGIAAASVARRRIAGPNCEAWPRMRFGGLEHVRRAVRATGRGR
jgi:hypothetical protein